MKQEIFAPTVALLSLLRPLSSRVIDGAEVKEKEELYL